jgi:hypothetical protein
VTINFILKNKKQISGEGFAGTGGERMRLDFPLMAGD